MIMAITRYEPWSLLNQLQKELERAYEGTAGGEASIATAEWAPAVDIKEESDRYVLLADLPGVKPEDIDLSMEEGVLTIRGEKKTEAKAQRENYKRVERTYGSFYRRFSLPDTANAEGISARSRHGVLEIVIPKREAVQPKKITVASED
jgi:HSP20 family protein